MTYLIANWKSNKSLETIPEWFSKVQKPSKPLDSLTVIISPPTIFLQQVKHEIDHHKLPYKIGAQDISPFPKGSYTGAIAADMLTHIAEYAIIGHSERRRYFKETSQDIANKLDLCRKANIIPILCLDEPYLDEQLNLIPDNQLIKDLLVAYEPIGAIGSGISDTPHHADQIAQRIKQKIGSEIPILYGGSISPENLKDFLIQPNINGGLIGGASLEASTWSDLINQVI